MRFSHRARRDTEVQLPWYTTQKQISENIRNKTILFVDDVIASGHTGRVTIKWTKEQGAARMYFISADESRHCRLSLPQHPGSRYLYDSQGIVI